MSIIYSPKQKNFIINGNFDIWQRGTSQTISGYGSADRWCCTHNNATKSVSQQLFIKGQTDVPSNPVCFCRTSITAGSSTDTYVVLSQRIEDVRFIANQTVTLSFWAKSDSTRSISFDAYQNFGTGGSGIVTGIGVKKFSVNTTWQKINHTFTIPSISGKTIGIDSFLNCLIWFSAGSSFDSRTDTLGLQTGTFDIAQVQLESGPSPTEFERKSYTTEIFNCQRYYEIGTFGQIIVIAAANGNYYTNSWVDFITAKRINNPSVTLSSTQFVAGNNWTLVYPTIGIAPYYNGFNLSAHGIASNSLGTYFDWVADAEL